MHRNISAEVLDALFNLSNTIKKEFFIDGLNFCDRPSNYHSILSYATSDKYLPIVQSSNNIRAVIVKKEMVEEWKSTLGERVEVFASDEPEADFYRIHNYLCENTDFYSDYEFPTKVGENCNIAKSAIIHRGVVIGDNVTVGENTVIRQGTEIEDNVIIGCNSTIGSEGFQILTVQGKEPIHARHVGGLHICSNVYIGDNTCICNSLFEGQTYIGKGAKIDNLVHVAHNLYIGENAVITAHVILCGSSKVEASAWIGPNSSVLNRVVIGKGAKVGLGSVVTRDVEPDSLVYGCPAKVHIKGEK